MDVAFLVVWFFVATLFGAWIVHEWAERRDGRKR
jgi:hypothetical protein